MSAYFFGSPMVIAELKSWHGIVLGVWGFVLGVQGQSPWSGQKLTEAESI